MECLQDLVFAALQFGDPAHVKGKSYDQGNGTHDGVSLFNPSLSTITIRLLLRSVNGPFHRSFPVTTPHSLTRTPAFCNHTVTMVTHSAMMASTKTSTAMRYPRTRLQQVSSSLLWRKQRVLRE